MNKRLEQQLAALATMSSAQLCAEWQRAWKEPSPPLAHDLLRRGIAWRLQERLHGGLPRATQRELERLAKQLDRSGDLNIERTAKPGTRLVRQWRGQTYHVLVLEDGYIFGDRRYASLTQIAEEITGAHWSGPRFFGLKHRKASGTNKAEEVDNGDR